MPHRTSLTTVIIEFFSQKIASGSVHFRMADLEKFVRKHARNIAAESTGRVLRNAKKSGQLDYVLLSRNDSTYRIVRIGDLTVPSDDDPARAPKRRRVRI